MATPKKEQAVQELEARFSEAQALVFTDFRGLDANQMVELRQKLRAQNLEYRVVKNRLAQRAAESAGLSFNGMLEGPTAICFGYDDPIEAFKQSVSVAKAFPNYAIKGGLSEGEVVDADGAKQLAELPSHEELLTQLAGAFQGPVRKLTVSLNDLMRQMVSVLDEVAKAKPEPEAEAAADAADAADAEDVAEAAEATEEATVEAEAASAEAEEPEGAETAQAEAAESSDEPDDEPTEAEAEDAASDAEVEDESDEDAEEESEDSDDSEDKKGETT